MCLRFLLFALCLIPFGSIAQTSPRKLHKKLGSHPIYIIDSVRVTNQELQDYDANQVTLVNVLTGVDATNRYGNDGLDGVVLVESKSFARKRYVRFFKAKSALYDSVYNAAGADTTFQYIINNKIQKENSEGTLALIDDNNFIDLTIVSAEDLSRDYGITDKLIGILIKAKKPENLYKGKKAFR